MATQIQQILSRAVLCFALSVITLQIWQTGIVQVQRNTTYQCQVNGFAHTALGTQIRVNLMSTRIVWNSCAQDKMIDL